MTEEVTPMLRVQITDISNQELVSEFIGKTISGATEEYIEEERAHKLTILFTDGSKLHITSDGNGEASWTNVESDLVLNEIAIGPVETVVIGDPE